MDYIEYKVKVYTDGTKYWYQDGKLHRLDGPAVEWANGTKHWYQESKRHRTDGPAIERANGTKKWYKEDKRHRLNGPAVEWASGSKEWYIENRRFTKEAYNKQINQQDTYENKMITINNIKYKLVQEK